MLSTVAGKQGSSGGDEARGSCSALGDDCPGELLVCCGLPNDSARATRGLGRAGKGNGISAGGGFNADECGSASTNAGDQDEKFEKRSE